MALISLKAFSNYFVESELFPIIFSNNGVSPFRRQAIMCTNVGLLSIGPLLTNVSEIDIKIQIFSFTKILSKISSAKWKPYFPGGIN